MRYCYDDDNHLFDTGFREFAMILLFLLDPSVHGFIYHVEERWAFFKGTEISSSFRQDEDATRSVQVFNFPGAEKSASSAWFRSGTNPLSKLMRFTVVNGRLTGSKSAFSGRGRRLDPTTRHACMQALCSMQRRT